jgi:hypothetical protein
MSSFRTKSGRIPKRFEGIDDESWTIACDGLKSSEKEMPSFSLIPALIAGFAIHARATSLRT